MQFLTRTEARQLNARGNFIPRKLTPVEQIIKRTREVAALPADTQQQRIDKKAAIDQVMVDIRQATANDSVWDGVQAALLSPVALQTLVEKYPQVEFEAVLRGALPNNVFMSAAMSGYKKESLIEAATWIDTVYDLVAEFPRAGSVFVHTPATSHTTMANLRRTGHLEASGLTLPKRLQERVNQTFNFGDVSNNTSKNLMFQGICNDNEELKQRVGVEITDIRHQEGKSSKFSIWRNTRCGLDVIQVTRTPWPMVDKQPGDVFWFCF